MKIKLFATDLDGTLLTSDDKISKININALQAAVKAGVMVTLATGRMYSSAVQYARQIGIDVPLITYNGALIKSTSGQIYSENLLAPETVTKFVNYCAKKNWYLQLCSDDKLYFPVYLQRSAAYEKSVGLKGEEVGWQKLALINKNVAKMLLVTSAYADSKQEKDPEEDQMVAKLSKEFSGKAALVRSKKGLIEVIHPDVSKANALRVLAAKFNFKTDEVMAIGDANNDLPMLKAAGKSVAMGNAAENIKAVCDYVTDTNDNDGVAKAIYEYVLK